MTTKDGTQVYYKDWAKGQPIVFSHGWPLSADAFENQMFFLASKGYRAIAHDRRGHGRSSQPWHDNDMDTYADDLAELVAQLDLKEAFMSGIQPAAARSSAISAGMAPSAWPRWRSSAACRR
jgi:non-heme chloroperoxidase